MSKKKQSQVIDTKLKQAELKKNNKEHLEVYLAIAPAG